MTALSGLQLNFYKACLTRIKELEAIFLAQMFFSNYWAILRCAEGDILGWYAVELDELR